MKRLNLTITVLKHEEEPQAGAGPGPEEHRDLGFRPAFLDCATCCIYLSRHRDGRIAPFHLLDGLPDHLVVAREDCGRVVAAKSTIIAGFERNGFFYTRTAAARAVDEWSTPLPSL